MAPAVKLGRLDAERVQALEWEAKDTSLAEIVSQLGSIGAKLAHWEAGDDAHPHPRNCVMNMVALVHDGETAQRVGSIMTALAAHHPSRSIILYQHSLDSPPRIDASIRSEAHALVSGAPIQHERVIMHVQGRALEHVRSLVEPLLIPDVRTHLWWTGTPPLTDPAMLQTLELCDTLVVDSAGFHRPYESLLALARLADAVGGKIGIADLHWARVHAWREVLAQLFEPEARRHFLRGVNGVGIDYVGDGRGNRVAAALLAGWLSSALGWKLKSAAAGRGGIVLAYLQAAADHPVEIVFRSVAATGRPEGEVRALRIHAAANRQTAAVEIEMEPGQGGGALMHYEVGDLPSVRERLPMAVSDDTELLVYVLVEGRRDAVYLRALRTGADLLEAAR